MWVPSDETREQVVAGYRDACRHADDTIEALPIDAVGHVPWWRDADVQLVGVLAHMPAETRRHLGHMDLIREQLDGRVGRDVEPPQPRRRPTPTDAVAAPSARREWLGTVSGR